MRICLRRAAHISANGYATNIDMDTDIDTDIDTDMDMDIGV
jgi:hypothetical protein